MPDETVLDQETSFPTKEEVESAIAEPEEPPELAALSPEEKAVGIKLLPLLTAKIMEQAEARKTKKLLEEVEKIKASNAEMMQAEIKKLHERNKPPDPKQLEQLLSQEYGTMPVRIEGRTGVQNFTLRELPQEAEKRLMTLIQKYLVPHLKTLAAVEWTSATTTAAKLQTVIDIIPDALDLLAACCVICLDPYGDVGIDQPWVQKNMSSARILNVVEAQVTVGKFRDFISAAYRLFPQ